MWYKLLKETVKATARSSLRDISLCPGGRRLDGKSTTGGMKINEDSKVHGPNLSQLPMSSTAGLAMGWEPPFPNTSRGHWMLSQKQCCKPTQNALDVGREKHYSPVLIITRLIRYPENAASSALLLLLWHAGCHADLGAGT